MSCPKASIASVITGSLPTPIAPTTSHWPASSSAYPSQPCQTMRAMASKAIENTKSGTPVLAAADIWSSSRPSNPAASPGSGPSRQSGSTAHDQHAPVAIPHHRACPTAGISPAAAALCPPQSSPRPSPTKTQVTPYEIAASTAPRPIKTSVAPLARSSFLSATENLSQTLRLNPHRPTPPPAQNPPRFPPSRLFGRLPPRPPSRPCPAGVRKPLTIAVIGQTLVNRPLTTLPGHEQPVRVIPETE